MNAVVHKMVDRPDTQTHTLQHTPTTNHFLITETIEPCSATAFFPGFDLPAPAADDSWHAPDLNAFTPSVAVEHTLHASNQRAAALWQGITLQLKAQLGDVVWNSWIKPLQASGLTLDELVLATPSALVRDWVQRNYETAILTAAKAIGHHLTTVTLVVDKHLPVLAPAATADDTAYQAAEPNAATDDVDLLGARLDPRYTFDNFVMDKSNALAFNAAKRVAESDKSEFNPLFLHGGVGLGKTHLMHAIAWEIRRRNPTRKVLYLSAEQFMYRFIRALRDRSTVAFKEIFRSVDVLMIDDVQFICGKDSTQEEFFHTFNALIEQNKQIVLSADKSPTDLQGIGARLTSRLGWGLVADIHPTSYELRLGILQAKLIKHSVHVPIQVLEFLASRIQSNIRELEGALNRIIAQAELTGAAITLQNTQDWLADLLRNTVRKITIDEIQKAVCEHYTIRVSDMHSPRRARNVARPRQVAMYLTKMLTTRSLPEIGRKFGGRDHTTVMHAVRTIDTLMAADPTLTEDVNLLKRQLTATDPSYSA